jgi:hypothetical protein
MSKPTIDVEAILSQARPHTHQDSHEIQPYGHTSSYRLRSRRASAPRASRISTSFSPTP